MDPEEIKGPKMALSLWAMLARTKPKLTEQLSKIIRVATATTEKASMAT
jgi:hypothetical protein